ncbi:hypothetical protein GGI10_001145 [Coemansia sp. RSA 2530]|nr:hypothetical protein GGI10_001145 [Coemansia sp. RSA 2530]
MSPIFNLFLGRSSQRPHVGVFSGPLPSSSPSPSSPQSSSPFKPAAHLGVSLLFENINTTLRGSDISTLGPRYSDSSAVTTTSSKHDMAEDQSANRTFAIVKPDALTPFKYQQINALIKLNEFEITRQKLVWLDKEQAAALFPDRAAAADRREWLEYITCAPCLALELAKTDAPLFWQLTMGAEDPNDVGGRDSDSIRGIIATDRIRNAVDGSQEPEDAVKQLQLAFSDDIPALPYDDFLMQRADEARSTLALVKPDVAHNAAAVASIIGRITARGYAIKDRVEITLSRAQASAFYAEHSGKPFFDGLVACMSSGPVIALLLEGDDVVRGWRMMVGPTSPAAARQQMPQSIRALLGDEGPRNAVHGSDSAESAQRELGFFFYPRIQPETEVEAEEEAPTPTETAVEDLSVSVASVADAAGEDKKKKKKKPKRRTKRKQPVTVNTDGPALVPANGIGAHSDDSDEEPGPFSADSSAPITPAATHIRFDQLALEPASDISEPVEPSSDAAGVVELAVATDAAHERTFALIKPDAYPRYHKQIVKHIIERGLTVIAQEEVQLTAAVAGNIYNEMSAFPTFTRLVDFVTSGPALALVLEGANAIAVLRSLVGPTNPKSAKFEAPNSLRAKYGQDAQMNAVHASKDVREARRSIDAVFYGLLRGNFRVLQPTDDPLAAVSEPHQPASLELLADEPEPEPESESEAPAVEGAEQVAEGGDAAEEQPPISINPIVPADESHLVSQMETLAVAEEAVEEAMVEEPVEEPIDKEAEEELAEEAPAVEPAVEEPAEELVNQAAEEPEADVGFVAGASAEAAVTPDQLVAPMTPPQTKAPASEKVHPLGNRLAASPFLKADRQLGTDSQPASKRVGRIKSPFLSNDLDDPGVFATAPAIATTMPELGLTNGGSSHELPGAVAEPEPKTAAEADATVEDESKAEAEAEAEIELEVEVEAQAEHVKEQEDAQIHEKLAALQLGSSDKVDEKLPATNGPSSKAPAAPQKSPQPRAAPSRTAPRPALAPAPTSATPQRTVHRTPASGPAATPAAAAAAKPSATTATASRRATMGPSTTVAAASRRTTLGPTSTATRTRVAAAATPTTPSVTTRSAARAAATTPLASRTTPAKAPVPPPASQPAARRTAAAATTPVARTTTSRPATTTAAKPAARPTPAPATLTRSSAAAPAPLAASRARVAPSSAAPVAAPNGPKRTTVPAAVASPARSAGTAPMRAAPTRPSTVTRTTPVRTVATRPTPASSSAPAASPRPMTRSMSSTVGVTSTASSRARAAAAAAKAEDSARSSASSRPGSARPSLAPGAPTRAGLAARPAKAAAPATKPAAHDAPVTD